MQRAVASGLARAAKPAAIAVTGAGASTSTSHCRAPESLSPTRDSHTALDLEDDDWALVGPTAKPVDLSEVRTAISELTAVAGASRPHIRTASEDGFSDTSDGSSADALLAEADSPVLDDLAAVVANLLNDPKVGPMVEDALYRDPKFMEMRERYLGQNALPAPARVLALPAPYSPSQPHRSMAPGDNPIDAFFAALVGMLGKVGQAVCALGNAIRRLPEDLRTVIEGLEQQREERRDSRTERPPGAKWEDALMRVIIAIAVAILARRMLVKRMV